jgi:hypothetical protein
MGQKPSTGGKRRTYKEHVQHEQTKKNELDRVKANVDSFQQTIMRPTPLSSTAIQKTNYNQTNMLRATLVAQEQLSRGGSPMTKSDFVAILTFLKASISKEAPEKIAESASALSVNDLIVAIRTIVYDPLKITQVTKSTIAIEC